ncbi:solute carrier family 35 member C2-like isoform X1 [Bolinopsis microptera]|uniref:solute carrier family 35 member C2-like isoform X1 n=1 Tax=Bolinopsis microptera TaxID=2820187 RepID=UPI00307A6D3A
MVEVKYVLGIFGQILFYYICSISITFFNKWSFSGFHFPLVVSFFHMTLVSHAIWCYRTVTKSTSGKDEITWSLFFKRVCPTAVSAAVDIGLSNWSFMYITVSMYTMCKSTTIIFILICAIIFKLEKFKILSVVVIALIAFGLFLFTYKSTSFNLFGFILVMAASAVGGLRWVLAQILLQRDSLGLTSTLEFVYYVEPVMAASILPLSLVMEGSDMVLSPDFILAVQQESLHVLFVVGVGATLALFLTFSEYLLLSNTSSITVSICGIMKEILILGLASTVGGDRLSPVNMIGLVVCLSGISLHVYLKYKSSRFKDLKSSKSHTHNTNNHPESFELNTYTVVAEVERQGLLDSDSSSSYTHEPDIGGK